MKVGKIEDTIRLLALMVAVGGTENHSANGAGNKVLTICSIIERGSRQLLADYDRLAAAMDLAIQTANRDILPDGVTLTLVYKDGGRICAPKSATIGRIVEWAQQNVSCNIYIGPGQSSSSDNCSLLS